jgi:hypothetical protein
MTPQEKEAIQKFLEANWQAVQFLPDLDDGRSELIHHSDPNKSAGGDALYILSNIVRRQGSVTDFIDVLKKNRDLSKDALNLYPDPVFRASQVKAYNDIIQEIQKIMMQLRYSTVEEHGLGALDEPEEDEEIKDTIQQVITELQEKHPDVHFTVGPEVHSMEEMEAWFRQVSSDKTSEVPMMIHDDDDEDKLSPDQTLYIAKEARSILAETTDLGEDDTIIYKDKAGEKHLLQGTLEGEATDVLQENLSDLYVLCKESLSLPDEDTFNELVHDSLAVELYPDFTKFYQEYGELRDPNIVRQIHSSMFQHRKELRALVGNDYKRFIYSHRDL